MSLADQFAERCSVLDISRRGLSMWTKKLRVDEGVSGPCGTFLLDVKVQCTGGLDPVRTAIDRLESLADELRRIK